jgi:putative oxidoreductase
MIAIKGGFMGQVNQELEKRQATLESVAGLVLRCGVGLVFLGHGLPKLQHPQQWTQAFMHMGFPGVFAYVAGIFEAFGGALLVLGLGTRFAAALLALEMLIAFALVDLRSGPVWQIGNYDLSLVLAVASFAIAVSGAGAFSLDRYRRFS